MKWMLLGLIILTGCVQNQPITPNGYATATWDENTQSNYFMLFYNDTNAGICNDYNKFNNDAQTLRQAYYNGNSILLSLDEPRECGDWNRILYYKKIVSYEVIK